MYFLNILRSFLIDSYRKQCQTLALLPILNLSKKERNLAVSSLPSPKGEIDEETESRQWGDRVLFSRLVLNSQKKKLPSSPADKQSVLC